VKLPSRFSPLRRRKIRPETVFTFTLISTISLLIGLSFGKWSSAGGGIQDPVDPGYGYQIEMTILRSWIATSRQVRCRRIAVGSSVKMSEPRFVIFPKPRDVLDAQDPAIQRYLMTSGEGWHRNDLVLKRLWEAGGGTDIEWNWTGVGATFLVMLLIPLLAWSSVVTAVSVILISRASKVVARYELFRCPSCLYDLAGGDSSGCPECGGSPIREYQRAIAVRGILV
jgi:hypothetical protein